MISMKNLVYVEVFGHTAGGRLLRLNNNEWRCGERLRMQMIPARMSLDSIVQYVSVELKLNSKNEAHIKDRHGNGNRERRDDRNHRAIQEDPTVGVDRSQDPGSEDGETSSAGEYMTPEDHEDAHFFAFVAHNTKAYGHDKGKWRKEPTRQGKEPRRIGNPPLRFTEYRREHGGCWVCYGKGQSYKHDHKTCKVYEEDKRACFQAHPEKVRKEKRIDEWKKRQADGGRHVGSSHGGDPRIRQIDEVAELLSKATEDLKHLQEPMRSKGPGDLQHDGAAVNRTWRSPHGDGTREVSPTQISKIGRKKVPMVPKRALEEPRKLNFASPSPWNTLPREVHMDLGRTQINDGDTTESPVDGHDQPKIYTIRDHTLEVVMHPGVLELHAVRAVHTPRGNERQMHLKLRVR